MSTRLHTAHVLTTFSFLVPALLVLGIVAKFAICSGSAASYSAGREQQVPLFVPSDQDVEQLGCNGTGQPGQPGVQANLLLNSFNGNEVTVLSSPYRYASNNYRQRPSGADSDLGYSSTITPSSEMAPASAARRAASPESGRASSPSVCSSARYGLQKKKSNGSIIITTTAQIHSSDEASDFECVRDRRSEGLSAKKESKEVTVIKEIARDVSELVKMSVGADALPSDLVEDFPGAMRDSQELRTRPQQLKSKHQPDSMTGLAAKPDILANTSELIEILDKMPVVEEMC